MGGVIPPCPEDVPELTLVGQPGVETLVQFSVVIDPELEVVDQRVCQVGGSRRHMHGPFRSCRRNRDQPSHRRTYGQDRRNPAGWIGKTLGVGAGEGGELQGFFLVRCTTRDFEQVKVKIWPSQTTSSGWPSATAALKIRPLWAVDMAASPSASSCSGWAPASHQTISSLMEIQLGESTVNTGIGAEDVINLTSRNAVSHQCHFQVLPWRSCAGHACQNPWVLKKSPMVLGALAFVAVLYAKTVDQTMLATAQS